MANMKPTALLSALLGCALLWTVCAAAAQQEKIFESGEGADFTLTQPTKAGDLTLQPGAYILRLRVSEGRHLIRFMRVEESLEFRATRIFTGWYTDTRETKAGEAECRMEPLGATVQATEVTTASGDGMPRITKVMVKGKADVCIF
ncbi:MAG TPA: hypothetical protein VF532_02130 [Candidatus Angelobacter sp.]